MSPVDQGLSRSAVVLAPGDGRIYPMGRISAIFKAGGAETDSRYSISEWRLEPHTKGQPHMPDIARWFAENPPGRAGT